MNRMNLTGLLAAVALLVAAGHVSITRAQDEATSIGGYGEIHYVDVEGSPRGMLDVSRFVIFLEHTFSPQLSFASELEVEHTKVEGGADGGEVALEQAYLRYGLSDAATMRAGLLLIPAGIINETHEPPTFHGVRRPLFDRVVIPTTWREIGIGLDGKVGWVDGLAYRLCVTSGLNSDGFSPSNGLRGGRYAGAEAPVNNLAFTGRLEYVVEGLKIGGWVYHGGSSNNDPELGTGLFDAGVTMMGADARYSIGHLHARGVFATVNISAADTINRIRARDTSGAPIGSGITGMYIELAYNVLPLISDNADAQLLPFLRFEAANTQARMPDGFTTDARNDRTIITGGVTFKPTYSTCFKLDWTINNDGTDAKVPGAVAVGVGYNF